MISQPRFDPAALAILLATAAVVRVVLGYRSFPSVDDFTYIPLGWSYFDPGLYPRDEILRGAVSKTPLWPALIWILERTLGLAEGMFLLTLILTLLTLLIIRQFLSAIGGSHLSLPLVVALAVTLNVRGIGRGAFDGVLGDAFHMQWLSLALVLWAYSAFVREKPRESGVCLGAAAWVHPLVAFHGAVTLCVAGLADRTRGMVDVLKVGLTSFLVSIPACISLLVEFTKKSGQPVPVSEDRLVRETVLFRTPHHYDLDVLPFLIAAMLGVVAIAALPRLGARHQEGTRRFQGLLLGHAILLLATFLLHGPNPLKEGATDWFFLYTLDISRSTPLFFTLCGIGAAAALPRPDEPLAASKSWGVVDRIFAFSAMLAVGILLLLNLRYSAWLFPLFFLALLAHIGVRRGKATPAVTVGLFVLAGAASMSFMRQAELRELPPTRAADLFGWARTQARRDALFIVPPGLEAFRLEAQRSIYVDFKLISPTQPSLAWMGRQRMEEIINHDGKALEQARGWPGVYWWDVAYAKRNPPERIASLLRSTGADFFVQDRLYVQLPPHLPIEAMSPSDAGLEVAFENDRYRVYRLAQHP
jgi:hypothetical protein